MGSFTPARIQKTSKNRSQFNLDIKDRSSVFTAQFISDITETYSLLGFCFQCNLFGSQ